MMPDQDSHENESNPSSPKRLRSIEGFQHMCQTESEKPIDEVITSIISILEAHQGENTITGDQKDTISNSFTNFIHDIVSEKIKTIQTKRTQGAQPTPSDGEEISTEDIPACVIRRIPGVALSSKATTPSFSMHENIQASSDPKEEASRSALLETFKHLEKEPINQPPTFTPTNAWIDQTVNTFSRLSGLVTGPLRGAFVSSWLGHSVSGGKVSRSTAETFSMALSIPNPSFENLIEGIRAAFKISKGAEAGEMRAMFSSLKTPTQRSDLSALLQSFVKFYMFYLRSGSTAITESDLYNYLWAIASSNPQIENRVAGLLADSLYVESCGKLFPTITGKTSPTPEHLLHA